MSLFSPEAFAADGGGPLYLQLNRRIAAAIEAGALTPGQSLPPEREMAQLTGLSRVTVRKAVQSLVQARYLVQRRGSGTFVAPRVEQVEQALSLLTSFSEDMARRGKAVRSVWLARTVQAPSPEEMMALGLTAHDRVARLERVRLADEVPLAIERAALPTAILPDPLAIGASLYAALAERGLRPVRAVQRISRGQPRAARRGAARGAGRRRGPPDRARLLPARRRGGGIHPLALSRRRLRLRGRAARSRPTTLRPVSGSRPMRKELPKMPDPTTHMQAEVAEIPAAAARFLDGLARAGAGRGRGDARGRSAPAGHRGPRLLRPRGGLSQICGRAGGGGAGRLGRAFGRLDLRPAAAAGGRGLPRDLAVGPEPGHRRDDEERRRRRRADGGDHQRRGLADGGGLRSRLAAARRPGAERGGDQDLRRLGAGGAGAGRRVARGRRAARGGGGAAGPVRAGAGLRLGGAVGPAGAGELGLRAGPRARGSRSPTRWR